MASVLEWRRSQSASPRAIHGDTENGRDVEGQTLVELRIEASSSSRNRLLRALSSGVAQFIVTSSDGAVSARVRLRPEGLARTTHQMHRRTVTVDWSAGSLECEGERVSLSRTELRLLAALLHAPGKAMSCAELIERIWPDGELLVSDDGINAVDAYVASLRRRLGFIGLSRAIQMKGGHCRIAMR
jgi:DNA-binding response OmpR family regulator